MNDKDSEPDGYSEIGRLLLRARQEMRLPIEDVSRLLHIRVRYLEALEDGHLKDLPGLTYTRGYLQSYASFLGLDKDEILRRFEDVADALARKNFYFPQVFSKDKTPSNTMVWGGLAAALAIYLLWALVLQPPDAYISVVEKFPEKKAPLKLSAQLLEDVPCLREQEVLYPPCTEQPLPKVELMLTLSQMAAAAASAAVPDEEVRPAGEAASEETPAHDDQEEDEEE